MGKKTLRHTLLATHGCRDIGSSFGTLDVFETDSWQCNEERYNIEGNLTYIQPSRFLVTISKQRIRSSAKYMFRSGIFVNRTTIGGSISHTKQPSTVSTPTMQGLSLEIRGKGTFAIRTILEGLVSVGTKRAREHADVTEHTLSRRLDLDHVTNEFPLTSRGLSRILDILYYDVTSKSMYGPELHLYYLKVLGSS
jgi:hypothetical protein